MAIHVALEHRSTYRFDRKVAIGPHVVRLRPAPHCRTPILAYSLDVRPEAHFTSWQQDPFGNHAARLVFPDEADHLEIVVDLHADLTVINPFDFFLEEQAERWPFTYEPELARDLAPYLAVDAAGPLLAEWLAEIRPEPGGAPTVGFLYALNRRLQGDIGYTVRLEPGVQAPEETLEKRIGSCRDTGWLLVTALRQIGLAARFASGYLVQLRADEAPLDGPAGPAEDFTDLHAWAEVYVPGAGWIGLDPTSGLFAGEGHIPLACTPSPSTAAPISGATGPCEATFEWSNTVRRIHEDPRVTKPYSDAQWAAMDALGDALDRRLVARDVRLTMGGEPTFVGLDDPEADEWTVDADGDAKRERAWAVTQRLADRFAPGHLLHHGQGKWYPGEPLPRWQIAVLWRADDTPLWHDNTLLADPFAPGTATDDDATALTRAIAAGLGIPADCCLPVFEDPVRLLLDEATEPEGDPPEVDVDPADPALADAEGRAAVLAALDTTGQGPAGWVIALHRRDDSWATTRWRTRRGRIVLIPGDSPIGLRLPLAALAWKPAPAPPDRSPFDDSPPLAKAVVSEGAATVVDVEDAPTTALCVDQRDGRLHVFLPPLADAADSVALIAVVEAAARAVGQPIVVEGYPPPLDERVRRLVVAPDPGVIEVNVHPAGSWRELVDITEGVHADARACRLTTETFQLDGTHSGTGGGNHLTLGAARPADSPLLRRPELLRGMLTFWQRHPSLSYLFSGRFIGPTSQAPRVDEGRDEALYELEISFAEMERLRAERGTVPPWAVDRLLRNLLVDVTGNTHRAEFCIDKLFDPDTERGRLGLLELRGFEMPPHPRMALAQALLVRAIVARCWDDPPDDPLVRWGPELHDRFLLPWFVEDDIVDVVADLRDHNIGFQAAWLAPFLEHRFPRLGSVEVGGAELELRRAIEPWPVLGDEVSANATARFVDSSVERVQLRAVGLTEGRHVVTCNGHLVPLRPTGRPNTLVAGIRFRAWKPARALHPTIGVHSPLVLDVVDRWNGRSLGGCTYHVSHPGGRAYDRLPVNANEADARRVSRFEAAGHTPGPVDLAALEVADRLPGGEYPRTLDLRRAGPR